MYQLRSDLKPKYWFNDYVCFHNPYMHREDAHSMGTDDAMSAIRVRKYDIERIKHFKINNESILETLARILNEYHHSQLNKE